MGNLQGGKKEGGHTGRSELLGPQRGARLCQRQMEEEGSVQGWGGGCEHDGRVQSGFKRIRSQCVSSVGKLSVQVELDEH